MHFSEHSNYVINKIPQITARREKKHIKSDTNFNKDEVAIHFN